jgi:hypothetical protein
VEFALLQVGIPYADLKVMSEEDVWAYFHINEFIAERRQAELDAMRR